MTLSRTHRCVHTCLYKVRSPDAYLPLFLTPSLSFSVSDWSRCNDGTVNESAVYGAVMDFARSHGVDAVYTTLGPEVEETYKSWGFWKKEND